MKTIGLIGGMSWESTAVYYRLLNELAREHLGGLHSAKLLMWSFDFAEIEALQSANDWDTATDRMIDAAKRVERGGAECILICTNTMHKMFDTVQNSINIPVIHIADATASVIKQTNVQKPILLATRYTMEQNFYKGRLRDKHNVHAVVPDETERKLVHDVIYNELCQGIIKESSKHSYLDIINSLQQNGSDGVILGCTEVGLLIHPDDTDLPVFDTTQLHAQAAMNFALTP